MGTKRMVGDGQHIEALENTEVPTPHAVVESTV
jgi:hypothetical protein